ncbi:MAG: ABC transporter permease [Chlamydiales bacterium]|nr:ABC transporter permease [Chlamydiales bacterium]
MWHRIFALVVKEIMAALKDKKARLVLIVPPITQLCIFTFAATLDVQNVPIGILNRDNGEKAFELVQRFHGSPMFQHIVYLDSVEEITPFIDDQKGIMVLSIDEQFSRNIDAERPANIQMILDGRKSNTAQIVAGYSSEIIDLYNRETMKRLGVKQQPTYLIPRYWFNPNLYYYWYNVPSLVGVLTMLVALVVTAMSVAREREMGTFDQLLVSPLSPIEIMIGKLIPAMIIGIAEGSIIIFVGIFLFQVPFMGELWLLYAGLLVFVAAVVGIGLFISSLCSTQQQAILGSFVFTSPAVLLSGFATPIENMPQFLQYITYANPLRYMLVISKGLFLKAIPADIVFSNMWPMAIIACFTLTAATLMFRSKLE